MKQNNRGNSPELVLEFKDCNIKEIVCSIITMFSIFIWDNIYKNPNNDETLCQMLDNLQMYIDQKYKEVNKNV